MQGMMRNPLVSPFTIGISPAAGGAAVAVLLELDLIAGGSYWVVLCAFSSALCARPWFWRFQLRGGAIHHPHFGGHRPDLPLWCLHQPTQFVATEEQLTVIVHWTFGTLNESTWEEVIIILLLLALTLPCCSATHGATTPSIKGATRWRPLWGTRSGGCGSSRWCWPCC